MGSKKSMETAELKNGRVAMVAITVMCLQEFIEKKPVTELNPIFFTPFWELVAKAMMESPPLEGYPLN